MIFLTQQDGNTSKDMPRLPKDSSELSNNPGFAKLEHHDTIPTKNGRELVEKWVSELMTNF